MHFGSGCFLKFVTNLKTNYVCHSSFCFLFTRFAIFLFLLPFTYPPPPRQTSTNHRFFFYCFPFFFIGLLIDYFFIALLIIHLFNCCRCRLLIFQIFSPVIYSHYCRILFQVKNRLKVFIEFNLNLF